MPGSPIGLHVGSPQDVKDRLDADRRGCPYLVYRDGADAQRIVALEATTDRLTIGRAPESAIALAWDTEVSRVHARLECIDVAWTLVDDGLSRNGTFVNQHRLHGRHRLSDGDLLRFGDTVIAYRDPAPSLDVTTPANEEPTVVISDAQRRVLVALCRPFRDGSRYATPPTNQQIAADLHLSIDSVKTHMRVLFEKLAVEDLPHNRKRLRLIEKALDSGAVKQSEL